MNQEYTNTKKERIAYCLIDLFNRNVKPIKIPIEVYCNLIGDDTINSGEKLLEQINLYKSNNYEVRYTYSARIITRDYVQAVLKIINAQCAIPISAIPQYKKTALNKISSYEFDFDNVYLAKHLQLLFSDYKKSVTIISGSFNKLQTKTLPNDKSEMKNLLEKLNSGEYNSSTREERNKLTNRYALPIHHYLNQFEIDALSNQKYELYIKYDKYWNEHYQPSYTYTLNTSDSTPVPTETTETYMSIKKAVPLERYKMSKYTYLIHIYLMHLLSEQNRIVLDINTVQTGKKETHYILEFDAKKVWDFWHNNTPICKSYFSEFIKAVEELKNIIFINNTNQIFLLPEEKKEKNKEKKKLYSNLVNSNHNSYYIYIKKTYTDFFLQTENIMEYPKKLISISSKTSYSQIMFYELLYEYLPYDTEVTETHIDISLSDFVFKTGKMDIADWRFQNLQKKYAKTANWKCTVFNELLKTNQYKRFLSDLNRYFVEPTIDNINIYLKEAGINRRYTASFHMNVTDSPFIRFSLVLNDNIMD